MPVTNTPDGILKHIEGGRTVWAANYQPVVLLPDQKVTLSNFDISFPHLTTANAYGYNTGDSGIFGTAAALSLTTVVPQEWDSGLTGPIATIPADCNYFQVDVNLSRIVSPTGFFGAAFPQMIPPGQWATLDGASALIEQVSSLRRLFRFERSGNGIYLRRKQSVNNGGSQFSWNPGNSPTFPNGGQRPGWTYSGPAGAENGWAFSVRGQTLGPGGALINRGQSNMLPVDDNTNQASTWRGTVVITPGYIKS